MNFKQAVEEIEKRGIMPETAPDLERMKTGLKKSGFFEWPFFTKHKDNLDKIILVAGTNGKGSTCAMLESLIRTAGESTGFYSSPHLSHYGERIRVNGSPLSEDLFVKSYEAINEKTKDLKLTHFEVLTLMALWVFASGEEQQQVDRIILEVGLGGRWDATNAVPHGVCVFTPIDFDHQNLLGNTLPEIAANKLDIVTKNSLVIHQPFPNEIASLVAEVKEKNSGTWIESQSYPFTAKKGQPPTFLLQTPWGEVGIPLAGARGAENASLALNTFKALGFNVTKFFGGLEKASWPARMELTRKTSRGSPVYLSGDHNPHGIRSLISLLEYYPREKLFIVAAIGKDKDRDGILGPLFKLEQTEIALTQTHFRYLPLGDYGPWLAKACKSFEKSSDALKWAEESAGPNDMILVTGSLYLAGEFMSRT